MRCTRWRMFRRRMVWIDGVALSWALGLILPLFVLQLADLIRDSGWLANLQCLPCVEILRLQSIELRSVVSMRSRIFGKSLATNVTLSRSYTPRASPIQSICTALTPLA